MKKEFNSKTISIQSTANNIYDFITDFNHFGNLLPEMIEKWESTSDSCSFSVQGITNVSLNIVTKAPYNSIKIQGKGDKIPAIVNLEFQFDEIDKNTTQVVLKGDTDINPFIFMSVESHLKNLLNQIVDKLKWVIENDSH